MAYTVSNPHPGFGKDKNIANELGHTNYPKMVYEKVGSTPILVNNEKEEKEVMSKFDRPAGETTKPKGWGDKKD